jgi:hypothetical protein
VRSPRRSGAAMQLHAQHAGRGGAAAAAAHSIAPVRCDAAAKRAPDGGARRPVCGHVGEVQTPPAPPARERRRVQDGVREGGRPGDARVLRRVAGVRGRDAQHERCHGREGRGVSD